MRYCAIIVLAIISGCGAEPRPPLEAGDVVVTRPMPGTQMSAAYLSLTNNTDTTIRISNVTSPQYGSVQLHESVVEDGIARMRPIAVLLVPAGETATLARGGKHLMLMRPKGPAETVSLQFLDGNELILSVDAAIEPASGR